MPCTGSWQKAATPGDGHDRPTLRERRPIVPDARDPVSPRKNARPIKTDRDKPPFGAAAHPPH